MSNIMQYLIQMSDEFRDSYKSIEERIQDITDSLDLLQQKIKELEMRVNPNRNDD